MYFLLFILTLLKRPSSWSSYCRHRCQSHHSHTRHCRMCRLPSSQPPPFPPIQKHLERQETAFYFLFQAGQIFYHPVPSPPRSSTRGGYFDHTSPRITTNTDHIIL